MSERELPPPRTAERLLIDHLSHGSSQRVLATSLGVAQWAYAAAVEFPRATVVCHFLDLYRADRARHAIGDLPDNLSIECSPDFPPDTFDQIALPLSAEGEAELTRDLLQQAHQRLREGGVLLAATDNPRDAWLHAQMRAMERKVARHPADAGVVYILRKTAPLRKIKDFTCRFAFRDRGRLLRAVSRPGVFAHRRVDPGARQLLDRFEAGPGDHVLDIGCGSGVLSLGAAARAEGVSVHAVDSSARAVQCAGLGAEWNALNVVVQHNADGYYPGLGGYDLVLANPPYYADFRIAAHFVQAGRAALRGGGRIWIVTKTPDWYQEHLPRWFEHVRLEPSKGYWLATAVRGDDHR